MNVIVCSESEGVKHVIKFVLFQMPGNINFNPLRTQKSSHGTNGNEIFGTN